MCRPSRINEHRDGAYPLRLCHSLSPNKMEVLQLPGATVRRDSDCSTHSARTNAKYPGRSAPLISLSADRVYFDETQNVVYQGAHETTETLMDSWYSNEELARIKVSHVHLVKACIHADSKQPGSFIYALKHLHDTCCSKKVEDGNQGMGGLSSNEISELKVHYENDCDRVGIERTMTRRIATDRIKRRKKLNFAIHEIQYCSGYTKNRVVAELRSESERITQGSKLFAQELARCYI